MKTENATENETGAVHTTLGAIFLSLELSRSTWLVTSLLPCNGEKMSKRVVKAGDTAGLLDLVRQLKATVRRRTSRDVPVIAIQEAGLDGFWIHRILERDGIESHVVDAASIATSRRKRRAKTDKLDGETLLRALLAHERGEPRVCAMVVPPSPEQEDRKRNSRERRALIAERIKIVNRVKGLLFSQGIIGFEPLKRDRRTRLEELRTGDGRELPPNLKAEIVRALDRIELLLRQIKDVEAARDEVARNECDPSTVAHGMSMLKQLRGVGADFAEVLWCEGLYREFANRRQLASYAGLTPTPWQSGSISREQGVSKAGNPRLRTVMVQLSWFWLLHQPRSALAQWFQERVALDGGRRRKPAIIALARKLLIALWKYVHHGAVIEGAVMKPA
ncbi:IS110 family transposase [Mesorhizobium sp. M0571]|uniref:IS110 family transposase n=1 Tax=Mesorhizobium sp. M0571 TaxID=2956960 RepID=UPI0033393BEF